MEWQLRYAMAGGTVAEMKEIIWQALHGCHGQSDVDAVIKRWGTWQQRMERESRLLTCRCTIFGHTWDTTHTNPRMIPTRERCITCGTVREWSGGPPPVGRWDVLPVAVAEMDQKLTDAAKGEK